ncbi:MAG: DUF5067 domain-containing protein [Atopobiaceae bacterium]|nr:DUF5067 domain-containing protein [Atopobiaceae bacterium]MCH4119691.1 DUF5067 domain-containing protein [Atopobiaceae bacterium]MCI1318813.1 DUF5067 domain-containing protein [Atopobiaceae bacterium]MCI1388765.1 DUF5067 domain-containing protein [Atopobiaceae bacterium]MCI1432615.1 DUF5067 domain-containing protein [Atopobiaceae bacterium]
MNVRRILAPMAAAALALSLGACGGTSDTAPETDSAETTVAAETTASDYTVTIDGLTTGTDYEGNQDVVLTATFTNNSDENVAPVTALNIEVYQDGTQQDMAISNDVDTSNFSNKVQPGSSVQFQVCYEAPSGSDVEVDIYELITENELASQTFSLS